MAKDLEEALVSPKAKLGGAEKPRMDLGAHLEYIESLLERGGGGSVDLLKPILTEGKAPVPNTGYVEKIFFNTSLTTDQVDSIIANANLPFTDLGYGMPCYVILAREWMPNPWLLVIADGSATLGLASGTAWLIMEPGEIAYYVSPALAEAMGMEAGWQKEAFASDDANFITVDADLAEDAPIPVGAHNDLLTGLVYAYSLVDSGETELAKSLTGQYKIVEKNIRLNIKENTTYSTYSYDFINGINDDTKEISVIKNIKVDIEREDEDAIINRNIVTYANDRVYKIGSYAFAKCSSLEAVSFPYAIDISDHAFYFCRSLTSAEMPLVDYIGEAAFWNCMFKTITFPKAQSINIEAFSDNAFLTEANLPEMGYIGQKAFYNCHRLVKVFISRTDRECTLYSADAFTGCDHILGTANDYNPEGLKDGYIYVPASLLSQYKAANNWSTYATQIIGHEDLEAGAALPNYATSSFPKQTWYSDEKLTTAVTSVATTGKYYCRLEA